MAQNGLDVIIQVQVSAALTTVAGIRATTVSLSGSGIDVTNADSVGRWREMLAAHGTRSLNLSGNGVFKASAVDAAIRTAFFDTGQIVGACVVPGLGTFEGTFNIPSIEYAGSHDGEATFDLSLESASEITFTAA